MEWPLQPINKIDQTEIIAASTRSYLPDRRRHHRKKTAEETTEDNAFI